MLKTTVSTIRLGIVVPTYNESKNIPKLIKKIERASDNAGIFCTVLIVDDNSPDGTGFIVDTLAKKYKSQNFTLQVLHRDSKQGFGSAYIAGFTELLKQDVTHILQMDADLSHDPKYIPEFIEAAKKADLVIGSRYVKGGTTPDWSVKRRLLSRGGNAYARLFFGSTIHDYTGGYNLFTTQLLNKIDISKLSKGYGFLMEIKIRALKYSSSVIEVPIVFMDRTQGISKFPMSTIFKNLILVTKLALTTDVKYRDNHSS